MNMSLALTNSPKLAILRDRAQMLQRAREFFAIRSVMEVDCPLLSHAASIDAHIDLIQAIGCGEECFLHTSPEYAMKRLLAMGSGDIYYLGHVFRDGETSYKHNPEFLMAEWYRCQFSFEQMMAETADFIRVFLPIVEQEVISYRQALFIYAGIDYVTATEDQLVDFLTNQQIEVSSEILEEGKDGILNLILGIFVEPNLGHDKLTILNDYPASQAALAKTFQKDDELVAKRFEIYYQGVELANGYHELANCMEQRERLMQANQHRLQLKKTMLPIDEHFLEALDLGLPDCCGVAVGVDRLMMLRHQVDNISDVISFAWQEI